MDKTLMLMMFTQVITAVGTIAALRVDISWIKKTQTQLHERITKLEDKAA